MTFRMAPISVALLVLASAAGVGVSVGAAVPAATSPHALLHASSSNWAGYAVKATKGSVSNVKGSWVVPKVSCPARGDLYSSFWVGIDGFGSRSVEQTGTDSDCHSGSAHYYGWYEFYPNPSHGVSISVSVGDTMSAQVAWASGTFTVTLTDKTTGKSSSATSTVRAQRISAEWIAEAPSSSSSVLPLADFGVANFGFDSTNVTSTCDATISGTTHDVGGFSHPTSLTMVSTSARTKASPSSVSSDGTSFAVTWVSSGP